MKSLFVSFLIFFVCFELSIACKSSTPPIAAGQMNQITTKTRIYPIVRRNPNIKDCKSLRKVNDGNLTLCFIDKEKSNPQAKDFCAENQMQLINFNIHKGYDPDNSLHFIETQIFKDWLDWVAPFFARNDAPQFWIDDGEEKSEKCSAIYYRSTKFAVRERDCSSEFKFFCMFENLKKPELKV